jgi:outer membrane protein
MSRSLSAPLARGLAPLLFGAVLVVGAPAEAQKLGVVEVQKVIEGIPAWKKAEDSHRKEAEKKKTELEGRQAVIKKRIEAIEAKRTVTAPAAIVDEENQLRGTVEEFQRDMMKTQQEFGEREEGLKSVVLGRIERVVAEIGETGEYDFIFEKGAEATPNVLYSTKTVVLTQQVIDGYKKLFGDTPIIAPTKPASPGRPNGGKGGGPNAGPPGGRPAPTGPSGRP